MYLPDLTFQINNSSEKVTVWGGMSRNWILLESYFFERNVDGGKLIRNIHSWMKISITNFENGIFQRLWWLQNGSPTKKLLSVRQRLTQVFGNRVVSCIKSSWHWVTLLTACDFFLKGYLKIQVFATSLLSANNLRERIESEYEELPRTNFTRNFVRAMEKRCWNCIK